MEDNKRLILTTVVPAQADVTIQLDRVTLDTSLPADVEITTISGSPVLDSNVKDVAVSLSGDGKVLSVLSVIDFSGIEIGGDVGDALRLASTRTEIGTPVEMDRATPLALVSHVRMVDDYLTIVDLYGRRQPGVHYLLREGGLGFVTYADGRRIMII